MLPACARNWPAGTCNRSDGRPPPPATVTPTGKAGPMALATLSDALPTLTSPPLEVPGPSARMASVSDALASLLADLDPGLLVGRDAASL